MWFIPIIISFVLLVVSFIVLSKIYNKVFNSKSSLDNTFNRSAAEVISSIQPNIAIMDGFKNLKANCILKFIAFVISALIVHFTDKLWITSLFLILLLMTWYVFADKNRIIKNNLSTFNKDLRSALFNSNLVLPIYQTLNFCFLYLVYILNK